MTHKHIITKFHDFSVIFHRFSYSMTFTCIELFSNFPGLPEPVGTLLLHPK